MTVETLKKGRNLIYVSEICRHVETKMIIWSINATFGDFDKAPLTGFHFNPPPPPDLPPPDQCQKAVDNFKAKFSGLRLQLSSEEGVKSQKEFVQAALEKRPPADWAMEKRHAAWLGFKDERPIDNTALCFFGDMFTDHRSVSRFAFPCHIVLS